jgi:hypothetical protein
LPNNRSIKLFALTLQFGRGVIPIPRPPAPGDRPDTGGDAPTPPPAERPDPAPGGDTPPDPARP